MLIGLLGYEKNDNNDDQKILLWQPVVKVKIGSKVRVLKRSGSFHTEKRPVFQNSFMNSLYIKALWVL
jgi:hypothetical protein